MYEIKSISFENGTKRINDNIKQKIASHLWMFCGYKDSIHPAISIDAKYIKTIYDLYNVIIDSSLITRLYRKRGIARKKGEQLNMVEDVIKTISMLRTAGAHTVSEENVRGEIIRQFKKWQLKNCGNDNPTKEEEFEKLIKALMDLEKKCFDSLDTFTVEVSSLDDIEKNKIIEEWENAIIEYYLKTTNKNIFENKLIDWYRMKQPSRTYDINTIETYNAINNWIKEKVYFKEEKDIEQLMKARETGKLKSDQINLVDEAIKKARLSIDKKKKEVAKFVGKDDRLEELNPADYRKHFLSKENLGKKIRDAIPEIKSRNLTLLPHDLFGYIMMNEVNMNWDGI